jgi:hypothetical protein
MNAVIHGMLSEVHGWLTEEEGEMLYGLAKYWPGNGRVVELGAYQGRSTVCLAAGLVARNIRSRPLLSVDTHKGSQEHQPGGFAFDPTTLSRVSGAVDTLPLLIWNLKRFGLLSMVEIAVQTSHQAGQSFQDDIRLLFVDADHSPEAVQNDWTIWKKHLDPSACVVLHDVGGWPGPTCLAEMLLTSGDYVLVKQVGSALAIQQRTKTSNASTSVA